MCVCVCNPHIDELILGSDGADDLLALGEVQPTNVPVDSHDTFEFFISQTCHKLLSELLQKEDTRHEAPQRIHPDLSAELYKKLTLFEVVSLL